MTKEWLDILLDLSYISGTIDGINDTNQEELLNASEQIQKVIGRIQKQLQSSLPEVE